MLMFLFSARNSKFSSAVLPESLQSLNTEISSGETFQNFYSKTKDIEVDEDLIKQLKEAQKAIDNGEDEDEEYLEDEDNHDERSLKDDYSSLSDFGGSKFSGIAQDDLERFTCYSCEQPDCSFGGTSHDCIACFTAHVRYKYKCHKYKVLQIQFQACSR